MVLVVEFKDEDQLQNGFMLRVMEMTVNNNKSGAVSGSMLCCNRGFRASTTPKLKLLVSVTFNCLLRFKAMSNHGYEIVQTLIVDT
ncbi:hypothetical protein C5167_043193 [Papaver somniferum]|uniref:Uncharacterized protein n=1 Tax=Papaver somniferum TaxID=3469 RepID=A0A4Y7L7I3_PAPSO|nr:hypothetical protein C5167_043193 [Papaver somniferum]